MEEGPRADADGGIVDADEAATNPGAQGDLGRGESDDASRAADLVSATPKESVVDSRGIGSSGGTSTEAAGKKEAGGDGNMSARDVFPAMVDNPDLLEVEGGAGVTKEQGRAERSAGEMGAMAGREGGEMVDDRQDLVESAVPAARKVKPVATRFGGRNRKA